MNIMGGRVDSEPFEYYVEQTIKAGLISRKYFDNLYEIIRLAEISGLKCFKPNSLESYR